MRVVVGISGGVDSAVAAFLLKEQHHEVHGVFMQNWRFAQDDPYCSMPEDLSDAQKVCDHLQIPLSVVNFADDYWQKIFTNFLDEYSCGRTPNPDVFCNKEIKFKAFLQYAINSLNADMIATGHYAICQPENNEYRLLRGTDNSKDQSYFLCLLNQQQLAKSIFPIGTKTKLEVREIAKQLELPNHAKKDSTGICFIGERKFKEFLNEFLLTKPGDIITLEHKIIGKHDGLMFYTIGQRKGLGIGGLANTSEQPWYVVKKDLATNRLFVAQGHDHPALFASELSSLDINWLANAAPTLPLQCEAQIRYRSPAAACSVSLADNNEYLVTFQNPAWAISPGQVIAFYSGNHCLGGGVIA